MGEVILKNLLESYSRYYDITENLEIAGITYPAFAEYHSRSEKYVLVKSARLWAAENHDYTYFALEEQLTDALLKNHLDRILSDGQSRINPHNEHMYSYISVILLASHMDPASIATVRQLKLRKNYKLSFHGWMEARIAAADLSSLSVVTNRSGKDLQKVLISSMANK